MVRRFLACLLVPMATAVAGAQGLTTIAEQSNYARTGRYDEVQRLCAAFAQTWPTQVRCTEFGRTPEGRPMLALVASTDGTLTAAAARAKARPVVLIQGGIHAGEIDGRTRGSSSCARSSKARPRPARSPRSRSSSCRSSTSTATSVSRANRPNQAGPEEVGWRVTSQNLNLNRDYVKAEAPEMQAMLRLLGEWDPMVYVDLHVTDGAEFEHDVSLNVAPTLVGDDPLRAAAVALRDGLLQRLTAQGSLPLDFYPSFRGSDDPSSGFEAGVSPPRFSQEYWALRNRIGVLVETHSWKPYPTRVRVTRNTVVDLLELAATSGPAWLDAARAADRAGAALAGTSVPLAYVNTDRQRTIAFRGYAYRREPSAISGGLVTRYDATRPEIWHVPLFEEVRPAASRLRYHQMFIPRIADRIRKTAPPGADLTSWRY